MNRSIKKAVVLGSGIMGSRIACHLANVGIEVLLLDIAADGLNKNKIVQASLTKAIKSKPASLYQRDFASRIITGNYDDDLDKITDADWIIEAIIENLEIKKSLYEKVEKFRARGSLITSNTSGIPIKMLEVERSEDFKMNFFGTHFFNPPRYLQLLEIIPGSSTSPENIEFMMNFGSRFLGKKTVLCKDTPAFIANRIGVFAVMNTLHLAKELELSINEIDKLTGPVIGRPKSATFRTCDVVGIDTLIKVAKGVSMSCPKDEAKEYYELPDFMKAMVEKKWFGDKSGQGFYKKGKAEDGTRIIEELDLENFRYREKTRLKSSTFDILRQTDSLDDRLKIVLKGKDIASEFYRKSFYSLFSYASCRIPEISDEIYRIDDALKAGFGYEIGVFETWDAMGFEAVLKSMKNGSYAIPNWINDMIRTGKKSFYRNEKGRKQCYDPGSGEYKDLESRKGLVILSDIPKSSVIEGNAEASMMDIGDGILNIEFHSKMNAIGGGTLQLVNKAIDLAEEDFRAVTISNNGQHFSAGANIGMMLMLAIEQEWEELDMAVRMFQGATMRCRYSDVPVVIAPFNLTLGGSCEFALHSDKAVAHAETYIGLVEVGVGIIPAGGGTKEMARQVSLSLDDGDVGINRLQKAFMNIATANTATSAYEGKQLGYLRQSDEIVLNKEILTTRAKSAAIELAEAGYKRPLVDDQITVLGRSGMAIFQAGINGMKMGNYISKHDALIASKLAWVICGGDLSYPQKVTEQYLLDLEREAFLSLCGERKTLERLQHTIQTGKPLRN